MCICCKNGNVKKSENVRQYNWVMIMGSRIKNKDMYELISKNIRRYRIEANMTQEELAMKANYSYQFIRRIEAPSVEITQAVFDQITRYNMVLKVEYLIVSNGINHYCCRIDYSTLKYTFLPDIPAYEEL